jgi:hypothetical protein
VAWADVAMVMGWPDNQARAHRVASTLIDDGLVERDHHLLRLPQINW